MLPTRKRSPERAEFLSDVLTTAVEGGINYWAAVADYRWWSPTLSGGTAEHSDGLANAYVTVHPADDDADFEPKTIGVDDIARAINIIAKPGVRPSPEWMSGESEELIKSASRENDCSEIDAGDADNILQVAMFGKVIYG